MVSRCEFAVEAAAQTRTSETFRLVEATVTCSLACLTLLFEIFSIFGFPHLEAAVLSSPIGGTEAQLVTTQRSIVIATCSL